MIVKIALNLALLALGYYVGKQIGRSEQIRNALRDPDDWRHDVTNKSVKPE